MRDIDSETEIMNMDPILLGGQAITTHAGIDGSLYFGIRTQDRTMTTKFAQPTVTPPVPEPGTLLLIASGLIGLVGFRRKFRKA